MKVKSQKSTSLRGPRQQAMELPSWLKDAGREVKRVFKGKSKSKEGVKRRIFGVSLQEAATRDPSREVLPHTN